MSKADFVRVMFNDISTKYDLLNDILSVGTHRFWKKRFVKLISNTKPHKVLDCATGTGDIAFMLNKSIPDVTGIDFSENMIECAKERAEKANSKIHFRVADIQKLPFQDKAFDAASISFGIRNVENLGLGLSELSRVSKSLYILEFGQPKNKFYGKLYFTLLKLYFPLFSILTKRKDAYDYLIATSETFPSDEKFLEIMKQNTNFTEFKSIPVFGGIAYIYIAK